MTASLIRGLTLPSDSNDAWDEAAGVLAEAESIDRDDELAIREAVLSSARMMQHAFGLPEAGAMFDWWRQLLPVRKPLG